LVPRTGNALVELKKESGRYTATLRKT